MKHWKHWTAEEHERFVATYPPNSRHSGHVIACASCGAGFRTTDWPPAICQECRLDLYGQGRS